MRVGELFFRLYQVIPQSVWLYAMLQNCESPDCNCESLLCAYVLVCSTYSHRWARLLKQQTLITVYHLPTKENKIPFSFCRKQMEGYSFHFPFAANKQNVSFSINTVFHMYIFIYIYVETAAYIYIYPFIYVAVSDGKRKPT
jgi:hypothetical protein